MQHTMSSSWAIFGRLQSLLLCLTLLKCALCSSSQTSDAFKVPVRYFEPSWVASSAQGSAIALKVGRDSMVICLRSPASNVWRPDNKVKALTETISGLKMTPIACHDASSVVQFAPSWLLVGPNTVCAMTGLASDVEHLCRVLQKKIDKHYNIFQKDMKTHEMTLELAHTIRRATISGGRPFGVQCLLVGGDDIDVNRVFGVYSMDPSGAWQSWGGATAIGKYAKLVRDELVKKRQSSEQSDDTNLRDGLKQVIECWMRTCKEESTSLEADDDYQVLVLRKGANDAVCRPYIVDQKEVQTIIQETIVLLEGN